MSVDDWARREADAARCPDIWNPDYNPNIERQAYFEGIIHAFDALLSDDAVEAAATDYWKASMEDLDVDEQPTAEELQQFLWATRIVIQAAIDAVTRDHDAANTSEATC